MNDPQCSYVVLSQLVALCPLGMCWYGDPATATSVPPGHMPLMEPVGGGGGVIENHHSGREKICDIF